MPKFLARWHYNEEEIIRHLKKNIGYWLVGNKSATGQILKKTVEVVKGRILVGWAQKSPEQVTRSICKVVLVCLVLQHHGLGGCTVYYVWEPCVFMTPPKNPLVYERLYV